MSYNIGLNLIETDGKATPSIQAAATSVAGFLILSERGTPGDVYPVVNWTQFKEHFGSFKSGANGAYALQGFFDNGGVTAYVTRLTSDSASLPSDASASVTSKLTGPLSLPAEATLEFGIDEAAAAPPEPVTVQFAAKLPAQLKGQVTGHVPVDSVLGLAINGVEAQYKFTAADFPSGEDHQTPEQLAQAINRNFDGIKSFVASEDGDTFLYVQTDLKGAGATLTVDGAVPEVAFTTTPGSGNISDISNADLGEAVAAINEALGGTHAEATLSADGKQIVIRHKEPGKVHTLRIANDTSTTFAFDRELHEGKDAVRAVAASAAPFGNLTLRAGSCGKEDPGAWGNRLAVGVSQKKGAELIDIAISLWPRNEPARWTAALFNQYKVEAWEVEDAADFVAKINNVSSGSKYLTVQATPAPALPQPPADQSWSRFELQGGIDDNLVQEAVAPEVTGAVHRFDTYDVQLICCPESTETQVVNVLLAYCENRGDCMFVGHTPASAKNAESAKGYGNPFRGSKMYGALYFPWIRVFDPLDPRGQKKKFVPPTGHILGVYARTDLERGVWKAPAGNAARLNGALDVEGSITDVEHTDLVKNGSVNAVRYIPGQGIIIDSSRTLSTNTLWLYVNVRLLFNFVKSSLKTGLRWVVQEPNSDELWNKIRYNSVTPFLMGLWRRGAFGPGAPDTVFSVKVDGENNPPAAIQQGLLNVEVYFYPSRPAETIVITVGQQEGGATAAEK